MRLKKQDVEGILKASVPSGTAEALAGDWLEMYEALQFYADEENYNSEGSPTYDQKSSGPMSDNGGFGNEHDCGKKARQALGLEEQKRYT